MIKKVEVRRRLALYEKQIKKEMDRVGERITAINNACTTSETKVMCRQSLEYAKLTARWDVLRAVLLDVVGIRCEEMFEDER